ncbi:MAG: XRE family transcriptional regulator [Actinomycetales bacterium]|nr:XRE family transcriptional regulator [Actinomycetales bacterium]
MANERLRATLLERGMTPADLAQPLEVDAKTVERWIRGRVPYRRHRYAVAAMLKVDESYLWPEALSADQVTSASESEIITVYPQRWMVPRDSWGHLFDSAESEIGILAYSGFFLADDGGLRSLLLDKAAAGVRVRLLLGDPDSPEVAERGTEEGIDDAMPAKVRNALAMLGSLRDAEGVELYLHGTPLYNSIYRSDDQLLVNCHVYGVPASEAPVLHLRRVAGGSMVRTYLDSFERVWAASRPVD